MKLLVTGGAGFIGSHLCELLLAQDFADSQFELVVLDNLSLGCRENIPIDSRLKFIQGDICNPDQVANACQGVTAVFHLAAMSKVAPSLSDPSMVGFCTEQNVLGTLNILQAAKTAGVSKVIYSASSTCYGHNPAPHCETQAADCLNPYALTKYVAEEYCLLYDKLYDLPCLSLRYFQVCGPRQPASGPYGVVAGIFIEQLKRGLPLTIHGDGSQSRDFVHVRDVAQANLRAFRSTARGMSINVGRGESFSVKELATLISPNQVSGLPRRSGDLELTKASTTRCQKVLSWTPEISFSEIVAEMLSGSSS